MGLHRQCGLCVDPSCSTNYLTDSSSEADHKSNFVTSGALETSPIDRCGLALLETSWQVKEPQTRQ
ncbi:hypothetical protein J6590_030564 [Homalodisca vitripennis]|nr:hypothetical protein J6590_030564 [Homalodisca vitripennis]